MRVCVVVVGEIFLSCTSGGCCPGRDEEKIFQRISNIPVTRGHVMLYDVVDVRRT